MDFLRFTSFICTNHRVASLIQLPIFSLVLRCKFLELFSRNLSIAERLTLFSDFESLFGDVVEAHIDFFNVADQTIYTFARGTVTDSSA